jgi:hypothetical protein
MTVELNVSSEQLITMCCGSWFNVKTTLPHVVGVANHVYEFVVWAEDSCYNRATGTVTIHGNWKRFHKLVFDKRWQQS